MQICDCINTALSLDFTVFLHCQSFSLHHSSCLLHIVAAMLPLVALVCNACVSLWMHSASKEQQLPSDQPAKANTDEASWCCAEKLTKTWWLGDTAFPKGPQSTYPTLLSTWQTEILSSLTDSGLVAGARQTARRGLTKVCLPQDFVAKLWYLQRQPIVSLQ